ncbi:MAG: arginine deiminase-related protein [Thermoguttaceae bacterium]
MTLSPHILMCPPEFYGIEYEINPWMDRRRQADHELAVRQWTELHAILRSHGAKISCMTPVKGLPDLVFTANAGLIYRGTAIPARFRHPQRQAEEPHDRQWFAEHGFQVRPLQSETYLEGAGDALFCGETLFAGYRIRSDVRGHQELGQWMQCEVIPLELVDGRYYHLDTCLCPIAPGMAIYYPPAFDAYARDVLQANVADLIPVSDDESEHFACNAVVLGQTVVTNTGCPALHRELRARGFQPVECPLSEFVKAGGSAKCLTLRLNGEDAAAWRDEENQ